MIVENNGCRDFLKAGLEAEVKKRMKENEVEMAI